MPRCPKCEELMDASETKCPFCGEPVSWEKKVISKELEETGPVGRGGWMIAVLIYLIASLFEMGFMFLGYFLSGQQLISMLCGLFVMYDIILIVMYFTRHRYFKQTALFLQGLHFVSIVAITIQGIVADPSSLADNLTLGIFITLVIAGVTVYLIRSKRVKNTYKEYKPKS